MKIRIHWLLVASVASLTLLAAVAASAQAQQQAVVFQQRIFESYGDGSTGATSIPCCTTMGTYDQRTTGQNMGAYFAEYAGRTQTFYGVASKAGPVSVTPPALTLFQNRTTSASTSLISPGGNLLQIDTTLMRTVQDLVFAVGNGPGDFTYTASANPPIFTPTFRTSGTYTPHSMAGRARVTAGPNQYGGTRAIIHNQFAHGFVPGTAPGLLNEFFFPNAQIGIEIDAGNGGGGLYYTPQSVVVRHTRDAPALVRSGSFSGPIAFSVMGTGWFTVLPYTTGMVTISANTIGTSVMDFSTRQDTGFVSLSTSAMGAIVGTMQLVSGHILNSNAQADANLAGTNNTLITFTPEPASAALIGVGALGLFGLIASDRRRKKQD